MSAQAFHWAQQVGVERNLASTDRFVLQTLADCAGEDWCGYMSVRGVARVTGLSTSTVMTCFTRLQGDGLLVDTGRKVNRSTLWQLTVDNTRNPEPTSRHRRDDVAMTSRPQPSDQGIRGITGTGTGKNGDVSDSRHRRHHLPGPPPVVEAPDGTIHHESCRCDDWCAQGRPGRLEVVK